jgi:uncharacterized protein (DUF1501 family)
MTISRRQFIAGAAGAGVIGAGGVGLARGLTHTSPAVSRPTAKGTLVLVALYGGNDGLNTVVPYRDPTYLAARPDLGIQPHDVLPLDNDLGLSPSLKGLKSLWDAKQLAIVRGVGYPNPNYSHFRSMDIWQSGAPDTVETTGWLGRWLDTLGDKDPLAALSIGPTLPRLLLGASTAGASIPSGTLTLPGAIEKPFAAVSAVARAQSALASRVSQSGTDLLTVLHHVHDVLAQTSDVAGTSLESTGGALKQQLDLVARLIKGGLSTRVYVVSAGGFDTHGEEKTVHQRLLTELDDAVTSFVKGAAPGTTLMTFSEFGRRVAQNASGGTDHGSAGPLFVAGPSVKGGFYGDEPSLANLDNGNLRFTTDFRSVYATVASRVIGIDPASVLLGKTFPTLDFV